MAPKTKAQLKQAKSHLDANAPADALPLLSSILSSDPSNFNAHLLSGYANSLLDNLPAALASYASATSIKPQSKVAHRGVIDALRRCGGEQDHQLLWARTKLILEDDIAEATRVLVREEGGKEAIHAVLQRIEEGTDGEWGKLGVQVLVKAGINEILGKDAERINQVIMEQASKEMAEKGSVQRTPVDDFVVKWLMDKVRSDVNRETNFRLLEAMCAFEALLELYECGWVELSHHQVANFATRSLHLNPQSVGRAAAVVAAEMHELDLAQRLAGVNTLNKGKEIGSPIRALVKSWFHLRIGEDKKAVEIGKEGRALVNNKGRIWACISLVVARGLKSERKYKEGIRELEAVRTWAIQAGEGWVEAASNRALVETAVAAHGRRSRQASTVMEEAAGSADNDFGVMECVWADALADDVDSIRMEALVTGMIKKANNGSVGKDLKWECQVLNDMFTFSDNELASIGASRLGQMVIKSEGLEMVTLERAQKWQMESVQLFKPASNAFAHLGWIVEQKGAYGNKEQMINRAIRCYQKARLTDEAHPLASRRLVRLLKHKGLDEESADVARQVADRNPRERWAHNVNGWHGIKQGNYQEAVIAFRNALKGKPKPSSRTEEILFGSDVGLTIEDNPLTLEVDSWRGLSLAYQKQGKAGPALSCVNDAIALVQKPPYYYTAGLEFDIERLQTILQNLLSVDRAILLQVNKHEHAVNVIESLLKDSQAPLTITIQFAEAHLNMAAKEWMLGNYAQATSLRREAVSILKTAAEDQCQLFPQLSSSGLQKRIGDVLMEAVTPIPKQMKTILSETMMRNMLQEAADAYSKALHSTSLDSPSLLTQDIAAALQRLAILNEDVELAQQAVDLLLQAQSSASAMCIAILTLSTLKKEDSLATSCTSLAREVARRDTDKQTRVALHVSIALHASSIGDMSSAVEFAISSIRYDPKDWRGWFAVGKVREADAQKHDWPLEMIRSTQTAYLEADKLGAGPCAIHGVVRCLRHLLRSAWAASATKEEVYSEACYCAAMAARAGLEESEERSIINSSLKQQWEEVGKELSNIGAESGNATQLRLMHLYPFLPESSSTHLTSVQKMGKE